MTDLVQTKQINEHVLEVSLNRPEKLNALTKPMWKKLGSIFKDLKKIKHYVVSSYEAREENHFLQEMILVSLQKQDPIAN